MLHYGTKCRQWLEANGNCNMFIRSCCKCELDVEKQLMTKGRGTFQSVLTCMIVAMTSCLLLGGLIQQQTFNMWFFISRETI